MKSQLGIKRKGRNRLRSLPEKFRVLIGDENSLCRRALHMLLREDGRFEILAEVGNADLAQRLILDQKPDIAVLDSSLPGLSGAELADFLKLQCSQTKLVMLGSQKDEKLFNRAISLGIRGYVLKQNAADEILGCLGAVAQGESFVSPALTDLLLQRRSRSETLERLKPGLKRLTIAERRILKLIGQGKTSLEIATECGISPRTVDSHRSHICEKLGLCGTNRLLRFALEHREEFGWLD